MRMRFFATLLLLAPIPHAGASARVAQPPAAEDRLSRFEGSGTCTGKELAGKTPHDTTGKYRGERVLDGRWVAIHFDEDQASGQSHAFKVVQFVGYDSAAKQFVTVTFDNASASYSTGTSTGWNGDAITFESSATVDGKRTVVRDVFATTGSGMSTHTGLMRNAQGKWVKTDEETCKTS